MSLAMIARAPTDRNRPDILARLHARKEMTRDMNRVNNNVQPVRTVYVACVFAPVLDLSAIFNENMLIKLFAGSFRALPCHTSN